MGVPSFYRWLAYRYPKIVVNAVEKTEEVDGSNPPNPNGIEFDNLYLDMNGIIHPCFHPQQNDDLQHMNSPVTYGEVFNNIFDYIDRIMNIVRPRKLLYMAIDGVAPRAKMNQQRTRRFRSAKDREILAKEEDRLRRQYENEGVDVFPKVETEIWDSNVITPGTEFMYELSKQLQTYICMRIKHHPAWKQLKVILSDANAPGEGEHKIMSFIRIQRTCKGYNPNTSHVLYGLDADLIMLALATHEIYFSILRENILAENLQTSTSTVSVSEANEFDVDRGLKETTEQMSSLQISTVSKRKCLVKKPYQFLHVWILREYLKLDLKVMNMPDKFDCDTERLIDDFIFICFFAGNDFLPHMPTLEIHEGAIDLLMHVYLEEFKNLGGYLVDTQRINDKRGGYMKLKRVEKFILAVGAFEEKIFQKRSAIRESKLRRILADLRDAGANEEEDLFPANNQKGSPMGCNVNASCSSISLDYDMQILENTKMLKEKLKTYTREESDVFRNGLVTDMVKFGSPGWKKRYYKYKFSVETEDAIENMRKNLVQKYTEGLCWVLVYYFSGVPSWNWYFPYHYAPFASDFKGLSSMKVIFHKGLPFKPFDQLMAVLPPTSAHALPLSYQSLMTDEESSILDFYPSDFDTDTDGKRYLWQGICKLPFIDEERLLVATKNIEKELGDEEAKRNSEDVDQLFIHSSANLATTIISNLKDVEFSKQNGSIKIDTGLSGDINGFVRTKLNGHASDGFADNSDVLCVYYDLPCYSLHIPRVLEGASFPEMVVSESEIEERSLWHEKQSYPSRSSSFNQAQAATRKPGGSFSRTCPEVMIRGGRSGWSPRGRGRAHDTSYSSQGVSHHGSWWDGNGSSSGHGNMSRGHGNVNRGQCNSGWRCSTDYYRSRTNNVNGQIWSVRTDSSSSNSNQPWRQQTDYYRSRTNNVNGQIWSVRTDSSGSSSNQPWRQQRDTQPRNGSTEYNNGRW